MVASLLRRVALLEAAARQQGQAHNCVIVHQYADETREDALLAEGVERAASARGYLFILRPVHRPEAAPGGAQ
jgi:hypothetical protein